jgi:hypothetical protein
MRCCAALLCSRLWPVHSQRCDAAIAERRMEGEIVFVVRRERRSGGKEANSAPLPQM